MNIGEHIAVDPQVMLGKPVICGTRIPVELLLRKLAEGATERTLIEAYPQSSPCKSRPLWLMRQTRFHWSTPSLSQPDGSRRCPIAAMRFLADESFDFRLVRALQAHGHDVITVSERARRRTMPP